MRKGSVPRETNETNIKVELELDGSGKSDISTGIPFFDHMLDLFTKHSGIDLEIKAKGDLDVDFHHTVEDTGIALGEAFTKALGDKRGINRYGSAIIPMDEVLVLTSVDFGGRYYYKLQANFPAAIREGLENFHFEDTKGNRFDIALVEEFLKKFAEQAKMNLHVKVLETGEKHHLVECIFKSTARAVREAVALTGTNEVPSTKGKL